MLSFAPKLRSDLTISRRQTAGGASFVIKDPVSGNFFRFGEAEQFIAQQFDGETPLDVIRKRTEEKFEAALTTETLSAFIRNLEKTGLLETEKTKKKAGRQRRIQGNPLYLRLKLFDPNGLLDRLVSRMQFFFTPHFIVLSAAVILLGVGITIAYWSDYTQDLHRLYKLSVIPPFLLVVFTVVSMHEFAHGLTCKHFGGEVHEMGFMMIYFQPALYCNVSDAWLFPEKSKRLWVGFSGPYFELFLWSLAVMAWRLTDTETWINFVGLVVMTGSGITTLLNLNPFIKLDGYYLLSDYVEIPNLRRKSFAYIGDLIKRLFGVKRRIAAVASRRERTIFLVYGLIATVGSFLLLGYVFMTAGGYLVEGRQPIAVLIMGGLLIGKVRRRFRRLFGRSSVPSDPLDDDGDVETSSAAASAESSLPERPKLEPSKPKRKNFRKWNPRIAWIALAAVALGAVFLGRMELRVTGPFNILPRENADVRTEIEGIVEEIYVNEGDKVNAGDVIAQLSNKDQLAQLLKTEAQIKEANARLQLLQAGPTAQQAGVAKAVVSKAEDQAKFAQSRQERAGKLLAEGLLARKDFEDAQEAAAAAKNQLTEASGQLKVLLAGSRREEIEGTRAQIEQLEAEQHHLEQQLGMLKVVSPAAGIVATPSRVLTEMKHQLVKKGDLIAKVYDFKTVTAQIFVSEKEIAGVRVDQPVMLRARAFPHETFYGSVSSISTIAQGSSSSSGESPAATVSSAGTASANKTLIVSTQIDNESLLLKPEMTGQAKIFCGSRQIADLISQRLARTFKVEFWSWW